MKYFRTRWSFRALIAAAAVAVPMTAKADTQTYNFDYYCVGSGSLQACASVRLQSVGNTLTMQVWNLNGTEGGQHTITAIGLYNSSYDWPGTVSSTKVEYVTGSGSTDITKYWTTKGASDISTMANVDIDLGDGTKGNAGIIGCTDPGGKIKWATCWNGGSSFPALPYVQFTFNLSQQFSLADVEVRWHSQQLVNGGSVKCDTGGAASSVCVPVTATPEPSSLVLLASGLIGVAGFTRRRWRTPGTALG